MLLGKTIEDLRLPLSHGDSEPFDILRRGRPRTTSSLLIDPPAEEEGMVKGGGIDEGQVDREEGEEEPGEDEGLRSPSSILVEGALVELAEEDSSEADMYWVQFGIMVGSTADLRSELPSGKYKKGLSLSARDRVSCQRSLPFLRIRVSARLRCCMTSRCSCSISLSY
jgi:hypothetical protein